MQGLVMKGWPDGVLTPGQLRHPGARTKGIADLSNAEWHCLQQALLAGQIMLRSTISMGPLFFYVTLTVVCSR